MLHIQSVRATLAGTWWGLILSEHDTEPTELWGAFGLILYGAWLMLPFSTFGMSQVYADLAILPEWSWGLAFSIVGLACLVALRNGHRAWRRFAAIMAFLTWFMLGAVFLHGAPTSAGALVFLTFAASTGWTYIRLGPVR